MTSDWEKLQTEIRKLKDELEASYEERRHHGSEISKITSELHHVRMQLNEANINVEVR